MAHRNAVEIARCVLPPPGRPGDRWRRRTIPAPWLPVNERQKRPNFTVRHNPFRGHFRNHTVHVVLAVPGFLFLADWLLRRRHTQTPLAGNTFASEDARTSTDKPILIFWLAQM